MAERRTSVVIDLNVGDIHVPGGPVSIPATIEATGGGSGGGTGGDSPRTPRRPGRTPSGDLGPYQPLVEMLGGILGRNFGPQLRAMVAWFRQLPALITAAGAALGPFGVALVAVIAVIYALVKAFNLVRDKLTEFREQIYQLVEWMQNAGTKIANVGKQLFDFNKRIAEYIAMPFVAATKASVDVLSEFWDGLVRAGEATYELTEKFLKNAVRTFAEFEQNIANTVTAMDVYGQAGLELRDKLAANMRYITLTSRKMAGDAAKAAYEIAAAGFENLNDVVEMTRGSIVLAEATLSETTNTAALLTAIINQFNLSGTEATRVANAMAAAVSESQADMSSLAAAMKYAGPTAHAFGITLEETLGAVMAFFRVGQTGSTAGTLFRIGLADLAKESDKAKAAFREFGVELNSLKPTNINIVGMVKELEALQSRIGEKATTELIWKAFSVRAAMALSAWLKVGSADIQKMQDAVTGTNRAFQMQYDQINTLSGAWDILRSKWEDIYYRIQGGLGPALRNIVSMLQLVVDNSMIIGVWERLGNAFGYIGNGIAGIIGVLGPTVLSAFSDIVDMLPNAIDTIFGGIWNILPIIQDAILSIPGFVQRFISEILPLFVTFAQTIAPLLLQWGQTVIPMLMNIIIGLGNVLINFIQMNGEKFIQWFQILLTFVTNLIGYLPQLLPTVSQLADMFLYWAQVIGGQLLNWLPMIINILQSLPGLFDKFLTAYLPILFQWIQFILQVVATLAYETLPAFFNMVRENAPYIINLIKILYEVFDKLQEYAKAAFDALGESGKKNLQLLGGVILGLVNNLGELSEAFVRVIQAYIIFKGIDIAGNVLKQSFSMASKLMLVPGMQMLGATVMTGGIAAATTLMMQAVTLAQSLNPVIDGIRDARERMDRQDAGRRGGSLNDGNVSVEGGYRGSSNSQGGYRHQVIFNVNSLEEMETVFNQQAARMKDNEYRRRRLGNGGGISGGIYA